MIQETLGNLPDFTPAAKSLGKVCLKAFSNSGVPGLRNAVTYRRTSSATRGWWWCSGHWSSWMVVHEQLHIVSGVELVATTGPPCLPEGSIVPLFAISLFG
jgi:hypothetical protein